jgi:transposase
MGDDGFEVSNWGAIERRADARNIGHQHGRIAQPPLGCGLFRESQPLAHLTNHHRHQEFVHFLNAIEAQMPARKEIHANVDKYSTHKHRRCQWLARHPRWTFHFTPASASWLNAVEGFFTKTSKRRLKRGIFLPVADLQVAINRFVVERTVES